MSELPDHLYLFYTDGIGEVAGSLSPDLLGFHIGSPSHICRPQGASIYGRGNPELKR